ncbi:tetraspanin-17-like [Ptychodera flava]|uniref:tetraspanin-17-like n=1 Tax=Ptychodera flava TaxID=63121 RepID=UPI003969D0CE
MPAQHPAQRQHPPPSRRRTLPKPRLESRAKRNQRRSVGRVNSCVKYSVFFYNLLFWLVGTALLSFGIWGLVSKSAGIEGITGGFIDPMWLITILGAFIFLLSTAGCLGALRENTCLLKSFCIVLTIIIVAEIVLVILAYFYRAEGQKIVKNWINKAILDYMDDPDTQFLLDSMQRDMKCCGADGPDDWDTNLYFNCSSPAVSKCGVPFSCCIFPEGSMVIDYQCGYGKRLVSGAAAESEYEIYKGGCVAAIDDWLTQNLIIVAAVIGCIILFQVMALSFVKCLVGDIKAIKAMWT